MQINTTKTGVMGNEMRQYHQTFSVVKGYDVVKETGCQKVIRWFLPPLQSHSNLFYVFCQLLLLLESLQLKGSLISNDSAVTVRQML